MYFPDMYSSNSVVETIIAQGFPSSSNIGIPIYIVQRRSHRKGMIDQILLGYDIPKGKSISRGEPTSIVSYEPKLRYDLFNKHSKRVFECISPSNISYPIHIVYFYYELYCNHIAIYQARRDDQKNSDEPNNIICIHIDNQYLEVLWNIISKISTRLDILSRLHIYKIQAIDSESITLGDYVSTSGLPPEDMISTTSTTTVTSTRAVTPTAAFFNMETPRSEDSNSNSFSNVYLRNSDGSLTQMRTNELNHVLSDEEEILEDEIEEEEVL
jgi:hypothetical protein